ncbi:MAG TPA: AsmA-like C-terminal region-containing protein, partial [Polyangiaceae bacterium]|nr:AsmA-like C-terminal region-containing protein [Polyangiaceae bacterium]
SSSVLKANGRASAAALKSLLSLPQGIEVSGATDWRATTTLSTGERPIEEARLTLDLRDFALRLPEPVGKEVGEAATLDLEMMLEERDRVLVRASLEQLRALVSIKNAGGEWQLDRGGIRADGVTASLPSHRGLRIEGALERFVLDDWLELRGDGEGEGKPLSTYLQAANVRIGEFEMFGYRWTDVRGILQATPGGWRIDVNGPGAAGQVLIPEPFIGASPLRAALERLVLTKVDRADAHEEDSEPTDPRKLPALDVHVIDLTLGERSIGAADVLASRTPEGLRFDQVRVSGASVRAEGGGHWFVSPQGQRSALTATVTSTDVATTLQALDYSPFIEAERGEIRADLNWPGGFDANILEEASGTISVRAENGQIVNLQPGAGRMLGLFSVAALPRRLALDFSDLTDKGLAFDTIHGDFDLRDGNAYTSNLLLRGPAAEIGIAGRTGFGTRDYDQTAIVTGNLGASLPVAGALAGGPAVGAALLLFSQVFKEPLKGITRGYYRITGPWDNPNVERVGASDAKDATARAARP